MATMEQVEKLKEKANVSYEEARAALDACGDDILEAMIYLERQGKAKSSPDGGYYCSRQEEPENETADEDSRNDTQKGETFSQLAGRFLRWCGRIVEKGNRNSFEVRREDRTVIAVPVTALVLLVIFAFWFTVPLVIVGLFFGCRYYFKGPDLESTGVNHMMDSAAGAAENLKNEVKNKGGRDQ